ncbi:peptidoglycan DD-metalloendopeptidase family protein, partial [Anaeromyxobacter oryzisoli]|uniref:peptidoglycan DD-metalloendopeptidase family protein n=1 Tax=Anaeromyxobacter oryzisoli TaxID=2925408 RepID=UPI001F57FF5E
PPAAAPTRPPPPAPRPPSPPATAPAHDESAPARGVIHVVQRGETLWRIARAYGIDLRELMETNGIADPRAVAAGAELFVPGASRVVAVPLAGDPAAAAPPSSASSASASPPAPSPERAEHHEPPRDAPPPPEPARAEASPRNAPPLAWPLRGVLYGRFGVRAGQRHDGIDIAAPEGTEVDAAADGTVIYAGAQAGYGDIVILRHDDGLLTLYAHASAVLVREGDHVRRGEPVARVGQTGRTTGPHLHFEVREGSRPRNPLLFLP